MKKERAEGDVVASVGDQLRQRVPSAAEEHVVLDRVWSEVQQQPGHVGSLRRLRGAAAGTVTPTRRWRATQMAAAAVLVVAAAVGTAIVWRPADDPLFRLVEGDARVGGPPSLLRSFGGTGTISSNGGAGAVLALVDGSRIEMRSHSELSLERANDGVRILLKSGGIIVNAAQQPTGHLYVQTKDMTVSVVGTVFLVNAEEQGSRVAVIEGEARVRQGAIEKTLRPGESVVTNVLVKALPVNEAIAWSRNAGALISLLHQSSVVPPALSPQNATALQETFELASIRPSAPPPAGGRGSNVTVLGCTAGGMQIDAGRFAATNINLYTLVAMAYGAPGRNCAYFSMLNVLSGGPGWVKSDRFDIQAAIPRGGPSYTWQQVQSGDAPQLQAMLRALLADRFKLVVHRETKEVPVFVLTMGRARDASEFDALAKQTIQKSPLTFPNVEETASGVAPLYTSSPASGPATGRIVYGRHADMRDLGVRLAPLTGTPVLDRTGLAGRFSFDVRFETVTDTLPGIQSLTRPLNSSSLSSLIVALRDQLGLELEDARGPVETLVIERAERPTEN